MGEEQAAMRSPGEEQALKPRAVPVYRRRKWRVCCGVCVVVMVALAVVAVALSQTVFKFRDPKVALTDVQLQNVSFSFDLAALATVLNVSLSADVRVDNPNYYDFRYGDSRVVLLYRGDQVGVVELGAGTIRSRKTVDLPAVITVEAVRLLLNSLPDLASGVMTLNVNSALSGRVNLAHIYKKHVTAVLNCTMDVFIGNTSLKDYDCKQSVKL
jgi:hypothetical protein